MDMQGQRTLPVNQTHTWAALNNPEVLKACIPGCDRFDADSEQSYTVGVTLKIGPVAAKFSGKVSLHDIVPPASYALQFEGQGGVAGFGKGTAKVELEPTEAGCELRYTVNSQVGGKIAQLGQRLIDGAAKSLAEDFFKRFEKKLLEMHPPAAEAPAAGAAQAAPSAPTTPRAPRPTDGQIPIWAWGLGSALLTILAFWAAS